MKDIAQEAVFFDLYYFVKFATDGERDMREVVNEGTPVFRDMHFENIVCNGATKGVFVRGLPEMPVRNITMENMVLTAETGMELTDADQIRFKNVKLLTKHTKPVILIDNGTGLSFDNIQYNDHSETLISVNGARSKAITMQHTDLSKAQKTKDFSKGADEKSLVIH
jgi:hypothetical protein